MSSVILLDRCCVKVRVMNLEPVREGEAGKLGLHHQSPLMSGFESVSCMVTAYIVFCLRYW